MRVDAGSSPAGRVQIEDAKPEPEIQIDPALHRGPNRTVMLRSVVRHVMGMRELDGPQREHHLRQVAAYALVQGPRDAVPGPGLTPSAAAVILDVTPPAVCNARVRVGERMGKHVGYRSFVERIVMELREAFGRL